MQVRSHLQSDYFDFSQSDPVALRQSSYPYSKNVGTRWFGHFGIRVNSFRAYVGKSDANNCTLIGLSRPKFDEAVNLNYLWIRYQDVSITNPFKSTSNEEWREELPKVVPRPLEFAVKLDPNCKLLSPPGYREMYEYAFNELPQLQAELRSVLTNFMGEWYNNWVIQPYAAKNAKINWLHFICLFIDKLSIKKSPVTTVGVTVAIKIAKAHLWH